MGVVVVMRVMQVGRAVRIGLVLYVTRGGLVLLAGN